MSRHDSGSSSDESFVSEGARFKEMHSALERPASANESLSPRVPLRLPRTSTHGSRPASPAAARPVDAGPVMVPVASRPSLRRSVSAPPGRPGIRPREAIRPGDRRLDTILSAGSLENDPDQRRGSKNSVASGASTVFEDIGLQDKPHGSAPRPDASGFDPRPSQGIASSAATGTAPANSGPGKNPMRYADEVRLYQNRPLPDRPSRRKPKAGPSKGSDA